MLNYLFHYQQVFVELNLSNISDDVNGKIFLWVNLANFPIVLTYLLTKHGMTHWLILVNVEQTLDQIFLKRDHVYNHLNLLLMFIFSFFDSAFK